KRVISVGTLVLLCACSTAKYEVNSDGSKPTLYPAAEVMHWPMVNGARQSPITNARVYIESDVKFDSDVRLGDAVRIGAGSFIHDGGGLLTEGTSGSDSQVGGGAMVGAKVRLGSKRVI